MQALAAVLRGALLLFLFAWAATNASASARKLTDEVRCSFIHALPFTLTLPHFLARSPVHALPFTLSPGQDEDTAELTQQLLSGRDHPTKRAASLTAAARLDEGRPSICTVIFWPYTNSPYN